MVNNICPICKAVVSENERLCPFCGTEINNKNNHAVGNTQPPKSNYYTEKKNTPSSSTYVQYPQNNNTPRYNHTERNTTYSKYNSTSKNKSPAARIIISLAITFFIVIALLFVIGIGIGISEDIALSKINDIVNESVKTENVPDISSEYLESTNKVAGQKNLYENEKYLIFNLSHDEYIDDDFYTRNYFVYLDKPESSNATYSSSNYNGDLETDEYRVGIYCYSDYDDRGSYIYLGDNDICKKLKNLRIGDITFEVYEIKNSYSLEYIFMSKPIEKDEGFLYVTIRCLDDELSSNFDYKSIIKHVKVAKELSEE